MQSWIKALSWYTIVVTVGSVLAEIATVGQARVNTPLGAVLNLVFSAPVVAFAVLVLLSRRIGKPA